MKSTSNKIVITITFSGTHDWLNQAVPVNAREQSPTTRASRVEVDAIRRAITGKERTEAASG